MVEEIRRSFTRAQEDYLKALYLLHGDSRPVPTGELAQRLGSSAALELVRHHRLLEMFLVQVLGYGWDEVHEEAERLEHVISERMEERIFELLGRPDLDPHGHAIPSLEGR